MRSTVRTALGLALLGGVAAPVALAGGAQATTGGWTRTATAAEPTSGLTAMGALAPSAPLTVTVALAPRHAAALRTAIAERRTMTLSQYRAAYSPTPASVAAVASYLREAGLTGVTASPDGLLVTAAGRAAAVESAFDTAIGTFSLAGRTVYANTAAASVPAALATTVTSVLGLNDVNAARPATNPPSSCGGSALTYPCTYEPQGFQRAYDATGTPTGSSTTIAIFAEGDLTGVLGDLRQEESANGLPQVPVDVVRTGPASADTSGADEWDLDTQYSTGMAGDVSDLVVYDAPSLADADTTAEFDAFVTQHVARAASASFGECEFAAELDGSMAADDAIFAEAAATGQTIFASAGDTGGFCPVDVAVNGVPAGAPDVDYPASSPYVVGVGGTTLLTGSDGAYSTEAAWYSGGGGPSLFERAAPWQAGDGVTGTTGVRTVPDIAMDGDPNSGADVVVAGAPEGVGGTSLSSPLALGVWARLEAASGGSLGFAAPLLYAASGTAAFHDIVLGDAIPYPALPGYDLATGLGTFDVAKARAAVG